MKFAAITGYEYEGNWIGIGKMVEQGLMLWAPRYLR